MAEAVRKENSIILANTDTVTGPATICVYLIAGTGAAAELSLTVDSVEIINLKALAGTVARVEGIHLGAAIATVALSGTGAKAFAISEVC